MNTRRSELKTPFVRMWSDSSMRYDWPSNTTNQRQPVMVGPEVQPPNTTTTCALVFPTCACCGRAACGCTKGKIAGSTAWDFAALDVKVKVGRLLCDELITHTHRHTHRHLLGGATSKSRVYTCVS